MTEWHTVRARLTSDEKRILDILHDTYGLNYNQSLRTGIELFARIIAVAEFYTLAEGEIIKKIKKISKKSARVLDSDIKDALKNIPIEKQNAEYEKFSSGLSTIFSQFDKAFDKKRKKGRKKLPRKRGKPSTRL